LWISWQLEAAGYTVQVQEWDCPPGSNWVSWLDEVLRKAERVIVIVSGADAIGEDGTDMTRAVTQLAVSSVLARDPRGRCRSLIPVRVDDCAAPGLLGGIVPLNLFGLAADQAKEQLLEKIGAAPGIRAKPEGEPPFPGTRAMPGARVSPAVSSVSSSASGDGDEGGGGGPPGQVPRSLPSFRLGRILVVLSAAVAIVAVVILSVATDVDSGRVPRTAGTGSVTVADLGVDGRRADSDGRLEVLGIANRHDVTWTAEGNEDAYRLRIIIQVHVYSETRPRAYPQWSPERDRDRPGGWKAQFRVPRHYRSDQVRRVDVLLVWADPATTDEVDGRFRSPVGTGELPTDLTQKLAGAKVAAIEVRLRVS
jgi:hypothetical protein